MKEPMFAFSRKTPFYLEYIEGVGCGSEHGILTFLDSFVNAGRGVFLFYPLAFRA